MEQSLSRMNWLEERRRGIGGSDAAAVMGLSKYKTPLAVWEEKTGIAPPIPDNAPMMWGRNLEPVIRQHYADVTGRTVLMPEKMLYHVKHPFMLANLDGYTDDKRVVEIKTARDSRDWGEEGTDEIPIPYLCQVQHYMAVTGFAVADVAVLIGGSDFRLYEVPADAEFQAAMIDAEADFWRKVEAQEPPEPVTYSDMLQRYQTSKAASVTASEPVENAVAELKRVREQMKLLEHTEEQLKTAILGELADNDTLLDSQGKVLATWKSAKASQRFDAKAFELAHADLYRQFLKEGTANRRFLVK